MISAREGIRVLLFSARRRVCGVLLRGNVFLSAPCMPPCARKKTYAAIVRAAPQAGGCCICALGVSTSEVVVRSIRKDDLHTDYVPVGRSTNLVACMKQMATPDSILITGYTRGLTEGYFDLKPFGAANIKGEAYAWLPSPTFSKETNSSCTDFDHAFSSSVMRCGC